MTPTSWSRGTWRTLCSSADTNTICGCTCWCRLSIHSPYTSTGRDLPGSVPTSIRWITWTTTLRTWPTVRSTSWARTIQKPKRKLDLVPNYYITTALGLILFCFSVGVETYIFSGQLVIIWTIVCYIGIWTIAIFINLYPYVPIFRHDI